MWRRLWSYRVEVTLHTLQSKGESEISNYYSVVEKKRLEYEVFVWLGSCHENDMMGDLFLLNS